MPGWVHVGTFEEFEHIVTRLGWNQEFNLKHVRTDVCNVQNLRFVEHAVGQVVACRTVVVAVDRNRAIVRNRVLANRHRPSHRLPDVDAAVSVVDDDVVSNGDSIAHRADVDAVVGAARWRSIGQLADVVALDNDVRASSLELDLVVARGGNGVPERRTSHVDHPDGDVVGARGHENIVRSAARDPVAVEVDDVSAGQSNTNRVRARYCVLLDCGVPRVAHVDPDAIWWRDAAIAQLVVSHQCVLYLRTANQDRFVVVRQKEVSLAAHRAANLHTVWASDDRNAGPVAQSGLNTSQSAEPVRLDLHSVGSYLDCVVAKVCECEVAKN